MSVSVSNIPHIAEEEDLTEILESHVGRGSVLSCKILMHPGTARSKGFGFVDFKEKEGAMLAVKLSRDGTLKLHNRVLKVSINEGRPVVGASPDPFLIQDGKLSIGCLTAPRSLSSMWCHGGPLTLDVNPTDKTLSLRLKRRETAWMMEYKLEFLFSDIFQLMPVHVDEKYHGFLLQVKDTPPHIYCRRAMDIPAKTGDSYVDMIQSVLRRNLKENTDDRLLWNRTTDFTSHVIGQSFAYVVEIRGSDTQELNEFLTRTGIYSTSSTRLRTKEGQRYASDQVVVPLLNPSTFRLHFDIIYKINYLVQQGKLSGPTLDEKFFRLVKESQPPAVLFALQAISTMEDISYDPVKCLREKLDLYKRGKQPPPAKLEDGTAMIYRLLVTPSKVYCLGPEPETSNRIIRQYLSLSSYFLRVNFVDENRCPLMSSTLVSEHNTSRSNIFKRIRFILKEGIYIGYRKFEFLAFSASQLREGQLWMFAAKESSDTTTTVDTIRAGMGNFSEIRNVAKCAARMGQCFSSSTETRKVFPRQVKRIKDINVTTGSVTYCFSDGIGKISQDFARTVAADCGFPPGKVPSAFQIRYGGYKGVVAMDPTVTSSFKLYLRDSMKKFESGHRSLEILEWTKPLPCHLNRQVISLLWTLGVHDSAFLSLQNQAVAKYEHILDDDAIAAEILQEWGSDGMALKMLQSGYASKTEPFLRRLLCVFKAAQLSELKHKANIPVAKGRLLMGCLDETKTLQYGQVYIRYTVDSQSRRENVVKQKVFVAKNPCLHPGDIRTLQAVDVPELKHMVDCIVFPQCGPRPHPNECSGSDLDGDLYVASWDESLVPPTTDLPMDYAPPKPIILDHPVEIEEIQEFFTNYMVNDNLGVISNAHVVHADREVDRARNPKCLELAQLASMAVDYPKTGVPAVIDMELRPRQYPDFMEKEMKATYTSYGVLGKLYRSIDPASTSIGLPLSEEEMQQCYDKALLAPDYKKHLEHLEDALEYKRRYNMRLIGLMNQFGIQEEAEILSGHILSWTKLYGRRLTDAQPKIHKAFKRLQKDAGVWFKGRSGCADPKVEEAKALAWYHVTYNSKYFKDNDHSQYSEVTKTRIHLWSFPWVVSDILCSLKKKAKCCSPKSCSPMSSSPESCSPINDASTGGVEACTPVHDVFSKSAATKFRPAAFLAEAESPLKRARAIL